MKNTHFKSIYNSFKPLISLVGMLLLLICLLGISLPTSAENPLSIFINNKQVNFPDAQPFIDEANRVLVPVRFVTQNLGANVEWEGDNQVVTVQKDTKTISLKIGEKSATIKVGSTVETVELDTKAILIEDRAFVPVRFISETFGASVAWDSATYAVKLSINNTSSIPTPSSSSSPTVKPSTTPSATPKPVPTATLTPKPANSNYDFSENPLTEQLAKIKWLGLGIKKDTGSYSLHYFRPLDNREVMQVIVSPTNNLFSVQLYWTSDDTLAMAKEALDIGRPEIADEVYSLVLERVRNQGSNIVTDIGAYKVGVVHVSMFNYPLNEQGVNVVITGGM